MSGRRSAAAGLLIGLLLVGTVACGDDASTAGTIAEVVNPDGKTFALAETAGLDAPGGALLELGFDAGKVAVTVSCNAGGGDYAITNSKLVIEQLALTEKACVDEALMKFDADVTAFITASPGIVLVGDVMTLQNSDITVTLREAVPVVDSPLEGTTWTVTGTVEGDATQSLQTDPATIVMNGGTAEVFAGCNSGSVPYAVAGDTITWGALTLSKKACDAVATKLERTVTAVLQGENQFDIEGTKLALIKGAGGLTLAAS